MELVENKMTLPDWVQDAIKNLEPPKTGKVVIEIECYMGGVTKLEIGGHVRVKPEVSQDKQTQFAKA